MKLPSGKILNCPSCGTRFRWRDELAGRKVSCKCGNVFVATEPPDEPPVDRNPYELYDDEHVGAKPQAVPAMRGADAAQDRPALSEARPVARIEQDEGDESDSPARNIYLPVALLVAGVALRIAQTFFAPDAGRGRAVAILLAAIELALSTAVMLGGAALAVQVLGLTLGSIGKATLKLAAVAVFTAGTASLVTLVDTSPGAVRGRVIALHVMVILYFVLLTFFFKLDLQESLMAVAIIALMQAGLSCVLWNA